MKHKLLFVALISATIFFTTPALAGSRLLATSGVTQLEGGAGGGLTPWAVISGYGDEGEASVGAFYTSVDIQDFRLKVNCVSASYDNRYEISAAQQSFELKGVAGDIRQEVYGAKYRLYGDAIYTDFPQVSAGLQYKRLIDGDIADAVGAEDSDSGVDYYVSATKVHLAAAGGYHFLWNATLRATKANQMGLLGYGGDDNNGYKIMPEFSAVVLLSDSLAVGAEYRKKPDNLGAFNEDSFRDMFIAWFPNKHVNLTLAYAELGSIAASEDQNGLYFSLTSWFK
ncbi:DUF3034 family protein [Thalassolituus sp.]|uniref:DUF3034 family protein n=1 Tax=Thalassolituus sp. TaxID=2030822 RepID=UPI0035136854